MPKYRNYATNFIKTHKALGMEFNDNGTVKKPSKYKNKKVEFQGIIFDSNTEKKRYEALLELEKQGDIENLEYHKVFRLLPSVRTSEELVQGVRYEADFYYFDRNLNNYVVEDVKSEMTKKLADYIIKKKLMLYFYPHLTFFENSKIKKYLKVVDN